MSCNCWFSGWSGLQSFAMGSEKDADFQEWKAFMAKYMPQADIKDQFSAYADAG